MASLAISVSCFGQLQNGDFEEWGSVSLDNSIGWFNSNGDALRRGLPPNVTKSTTVHGGVAAIRLETVGTITEPVFGYFSNSPDPFAGIGGAPFTDQPDSISFFVRTGVVTGDSANLVVVFKKAGTPIGFNLFKFTGNNPSSWQRMAFKLGTLPMAPDTVIIAMSPSNASTQSGIQPGSNIIVDDLAFNGTQQIPNGDFEIWANLTIEYLEHFVNPNFEWALKGMTPPVTKTTDAYQGSYALQVTTQAGGPGWMFTGFNNGQWDQALMDYSGGFAYARQVDTLIGWYKYFPKDTSKKAQVNVNFQTADTTFSALGVRLSKADSYTKFEIPFSLSVMPDTAIITINSSEYPVTLADTGSTLILDGLQFKSAPLSGVADNTPDDYPVLVYPNPAAGAFVLEYSPLAQGSATCLIYDNLGRVLESRPINAPRTTIDLSVYGQGIYFLNVIDLNRNFSRKIVLH